MRCTITVQENVKIGTLLVHTMIRFVSRLTSVGPWREASSCEHRFPPMAATDGYTEYWSALLYYRNRRRFVGVALQGDR